MGALDLGVVVLTVASLVPRARCDVAACGPTHPSVTIVISGPKSQQGAAPRGRGALPAPHIFGSGVTVNVLASSSACRRRCLQRPRLNCVHQAPGPPRAAHAPCALAASPQREPSPGRASPAGSPRRRRSSAARPRAPSVKTTTSTSLSPSFPLAPLSPAMPLQRTMVGCMPRCSMFRTDRCASGGVLCPNWGSRAGAGDQKWGKLRGVLPPERHAVHGVPVWREDHRAQLQRPKRLSPHEPGRQH